MTDDPFARFRKSLEQVRGTEPLEGTAMVLATSDAGGRPSARFVLLKEADDRGFVFYTNYGSRKARDLEANPQASLCFHWPSIEQQVRVEGRVERVSPEESDAYFATRPRDSQLGAWASQQSEPVSSREELEARFRAMQERFPPGAAVPRPPQWGGYRLVPDLFEFWYGREHRLHDRLVYEASQKGWTRRRLYP